jgi:DNA-binding LacI/PurR family transcriptional regulator
VSPATRERRVTLADVAQATGVSAATVSRALLHDSRISARTRELVARAAEQLSYVPNQAARSLVLRATRTLGLLVPEVTDPLHGQVVAGFEHEAAAAGYSVLVANGLGDPARERRALALFGAQQADGVALLGSILDQRQVVAAMRPSRVVFINTENLSLAGYASDLAAGCIRADEVAGIDALVQHVVQDGGYQRVGYLNGPPLASNVIRREAAARALERLAASGCPVDPSLRQYSSGEDGWRSGSRLLARFGEDRARPDALLCYDDKLALAAMDSLRTNGLRVPDDLAVVGFDDIPFAALANPRLTTVAQPSVDMGRLAVEMLLSSIQQDEMPPSVSLPVRLVVRQSSTAA